MENERFDQIARIVSSRRALFGGLTALASTLWRVRPAHAAATMTLSRSSGTVGQSVAVSLNGFIPGDTARILWFDGTTSRKIKRGIAIGSGGTASTTFSIPSAVRGDHRVRAVGNAGRRAEGTITVKTRVIITPAQATWGTTLTMKVTGYLPNRYIAPTWRAASEPVASGRVVEYFPTNSRGLMSVAIELNSSLANKSATTYVYEARDRGPASGAPTSAPGTLVGSRSISVTCPMSGDTTCCLESGSCSAQLPCCNGLICIDGICND